MKLKNYIAQKSPAILIGFGIAGFIGTAILASRIAPDAKQHLEEVKERPLIERVKTGVLLYAPVIGMGMFSTGCILMGTRIISYRFASLAMLYSMSEKQLEKMQAAVLEEFGATGAETIQRNLAKPVGEPPIEIEGNGRMLFYDVWTGRYFRKDSVETIRRAVNDVNELAIGEDFASVNEFYECLGLPKIQKGDEAGWRADSELLVVTYDSFLKDGFEPCVSITFRVEPKDYQPY